MLVEKLIEKKSRLWGYGIAILAVAIASILKLLLNAIIPVESSYWLYCAAVTLSSLYGSWQAGILATILSALMSNYFFLTPTDPLLVSSLGQNLGLVIFICEGLLIARIVSELQLERSRLETILQQMPVGIVVADAATGKMIFGNKEMEKIFRHPFIAAKNIEQYREYKSFHLDGRPYQPYETVTARTITCGEAIREEVITILRGDGTYGTILANSTPLYNTEGKIEAGIVTFFDISERQAALHERKQAQEQLTNLNKILEERVIERTAQLEQARNEAQVSFNRLNGIIESTKDLIVALDLDLRFIAFNSAYKQEFARIKGKQIELGMSIIDVLADLPTEQAKAREICGRALQGEQFTIVEQFGNPNKLEFGYYEVICNPIKDENNRLIGACQMARNVSDRIHIENQIRQLNQELEKRVIERTQALQAEIQERIKIEANLRESEEKFRATFNQAAVGIVHANLDGQYQLINQKLCDIFGYTEAEMTKLSIADITYPEDLEADLEKTHRLLAGEIPSFSMEKRYVRKDGAIVWGNLTVSMLRGTNGEPKYLIGVVQDISDRKQAEDALRKSEEHFRNLADSMPQIVWTANADGIVDYYNQRMHEFSGFVQKQDGTWQWQAVLHPDDQQRTLEAWLHTVATGEIYECSHRLKRRDGEFRWHLSRGTPVKDEQGRIVKWYGTATDIHAQKQYQAEREELLRREQLARTEAESASRMKDEFLATLSHELRTPMNAMLGWTSMLRTRKLNEATVARALETIERSTKTLNQLIEDILDVSRIMRGKVRLTLQPLQLLLVIEQAIEIIKPSAEVKNIQILVEPPQENSLKVMGDSSRLQQIVWNLLSNAIKFTPKDGRVTVRLSVSEGTGNEEKVDIDQSPVISHQSPVVGAGLVSNSNLQPITSNQNPPVHQSTVTQYAQIQVIDTGIGIDPEFLPYVFDRFRQADGSITRSHGGLGLGLAIVRHLVELHGGKVEVYSLGLRQGATFTVNLPLVVDNIGEGEPETKADDSSELGSDSLLLKNLQVLVVDDEPDVRDLVTLILEDRGAKVTSVGSAQAALTALQKLHPDIIVSDIGMPDLDGYSFIRQIRKLPPEVGGEIPAIALTAYASAEDRNATLNAGFNRHIAKPVEPTELIVAITNLISTRISIAYTNNVNPA